MGASGLGGLGDVSRGPQERFKEITGVTREVPKGPRGITGDFR